MDLEVQSTQVQGYFHPSSGRYLFTQRKHTYDGNPQTSSAIKAIEEIKYELSTPVKCASSEINRWASLRGSTSRERSKSYGGTEQTGEMSGFPSYRNEKDEKNLQGRFVRKKCSYKDN
ncbi:unnamed protein product [Ranitomeya imitator]|uniref:Uncharacterized protein n=1 Tax=Ranitomeya imitator TaxID=111125 RepID=A0ABN9KWK5_9NEOB|nr:unnamed protein product [Ranitomeya imitator]